MLVFHRTSEETDGESVLVETIVRPHGFVAAAHVHPHQTERFEVLEGLLGFASATKSSSQDQATSPWSRRVRPTASGTPGEDEARFLCEVRPALKFESLIETMFTLAAEGKTNRKGMPSPIRLVVIAQAHFDTVRLPFPPAILQRAALAVGAPLGKMLGYRATTTRQPPLADDAHPHSRPTRTYDRGRPHDPASARARERKG